MSAKGKSKDTGKRKRKGSSGSGQRVSAFAVDLSAEVKKTIKVSGDFWGGDSKQVFTCDVLQYDPHYEFPNLRKGDPNSTLLRHIHPLISCYF